MIINFVVLFQLLFLRAVREGDVDEVNSMLQNIDIDIDVNYCDHVSVVNFTLMTFS